MISYIKLSKNGEALIYILGWYFFSLSISIYNKWMFGKGLDFKFPILITSFHQFCLMILSTLVLYFNPRLRPTINSNRSTGIDTISDDDNDSLDSDTPSGSSNSTSALTSPSNFSPLNNYTVASPAPSAFGSSSFVAFLAIFKIGVLTYIKQILPCSLASAGDIGLSNVSFKFVSLSLYTMLKTSSLVFVLMFGLLFRLERFHWRLVIIVIIMTGSVMMMVKKSTPISSSDVNHNEDENSGIGIFLVLGASMMSGLRWSFTQLLLKHNDYTNNSISTIFYISPSMCAILFFVGLIVEGWSQFISSPIWEAKGILSTIGLMIVPGILAFMMTLCEFKLLTVAQIITLSIAGIFKELLTIILSTIIFGDRLSFVNCLGLVFTFVDIMWYNYYRYKENANATNKEYSSVATSAADQTSNSELGNSSIDTIIENDSARGGSRNGITNVELRKL